MSRGKKTFGWRRWFGVSMAVVGLCSAGPANAVVLDFDPDPLVLLVDQEFDVSVVVDAAAVDLKTFDISFVYDPAVIEILSVQAGALLVDSGATLFFDSDLVADTVRAVASVLGPGVSFDGPGEVVRFRVKGLAPGISTQVIHRRVLIDVNGAQPEVEVGDGVIEVHAPSVDVGTPVRVLAIRAATSPSYGGGKVEYSVPEGRTATVRWFDARGRALGSRKLAGGAGRLDLGLPGSGLYWVEIRSGSDVRRTRLVVLP